MAIAKHAWRLAALVSATLVSACAAGPEIHSYKGSGYEPLGEGQVSVFPGSGVVAHRAFTAQTLVKLVSRNDKLFVCAAFVYRADPLVAYRVRTEFPGEVAIIIGGNGRQEEGFSGSFMEGYPRDNLNVPLMDLRNVMLSCVESRYSWNGIAPAEIPVHMKSTSKW